MFIRLRTKITVCTGTWLSSSRTQKPRFDSRHEARYFNLPNRSEWLWGPHSFLRNRHWDQGGGRKRPVYDAGHPPQIWTEIKNVWSRKFTPPIPNVFVLYIGLPLPRRQTEIMNGTYGTSYTIQRQVWNIYLSCGKDFFSDCFWGTFYFFFIYMKHFAKAQQDTPLQCKPIQTQVKFMYCILKDTTIMRLRRFWSNKT